MDNEQALFEVIHEHFSQSTGGHIMTIAESLEARGYKRGVEQGRNEGRNEGINQGINKGKQLGIHLIANNLLKEGLPLNTISKVTGLAVQDIQDMQINQVT